MRYATIGTSSIVDRFTDAVVLVDDAHYTVAFSRDAERAGHYAAAHGGERGVSSLDELAAADDVDAVYVASPNALHHAQAKRLLGAGKHVLVEKSACANAAEWADLLELARARGVLLLESVRSVHEPSWQVLAAHVPSLGPIRQVNLQMCQRSRRYDAYLSGRVENIFRPQMAAGALMDLGVYCLHPLVTLFGAPRSVQAGSVLLRENVGLDGIDAATTLLLGYDGFVATITCSKVSTNPAPGVIAGEDASLVVDAIADPHSLAMVCAVSGQDEELAFDKALPQQAYVLKAFAEMAADPLGERARRHQQATADALAVCDEARRQTGVRFPNDEFRAVAAS